MQDIQFIRNNPIEFDNLINKRGLKPISKKILEIDSEKRKSQSVLQKLQEKRNEISKEIGLLKSLGCSLKKIRFIFLLDGVIIGTMGTSLGGIVGLGLIWIQKKYQLISIPSDVYFMDRIPVMISWKYFIIIIFLSIIISIISSIIPTAYTEKIKPSEAISYE